MAIIDQFISRYTKEYDYYEQASRMAAQLLDAHLQSSGIRAIVTSRAKNPSRLKTKTQQRNTKKQYTSVEDIYSDIVDLAGVRVALYFPAERDEVKKLIQSLFEIVGYPKEFPQDPPAPPQPEYKKRFNGYWATHYRVFIRDNYLNESQKRYSEARLEIQVASVLMHAWSEVEHDLVYKPLQGNLSVDEYAILDELNGMVLAGEIALERLQRAAEARISKGDQEFANHYDLASSLFELSREKIGKTSLDASSTGRVDQLFMLLQKLNLNKPEHLSKYIEALHSDLEMRPLAEQVIDQILAEDLSRYPVYEKIRGIDAENASLKITHNNERPPKAPIGEFMGLWIEFERTIRSLVHESHPDLIQIGMTLPKTIALLSLTPELKETIDRIRQFRNMLVHGIEVPDTEYIRSQSIALKRVIEGIRKKNSSFKAKSKKSSETS